MNFKGDALDVNVIDEGQGECVLILHGWGAYGEVYRLIINLLKPHFRVIAPDLPGFGKTTEPSFAYDNNDYVDFVKALVKQMGIDSLSIIGHSHGGRTAINLASGDFDFTLKNLVLIDSAGILPKKTLKKTLKIKMYKTAKWFYSLKPMKKLFPDALEKAKKKYGSADYAAASEIMRQSLVRNVNTDLSGVLCKIKVPTLLIWGENDTATPLSDAKIMEKSIPDCGLVTIKNGSHFSFADNFPLTVSVLKSFYKF